MNLFDFNDPFFKPLWLRVAVVAVACGWGIFEFIAGAPFWGVLFCGLGVLAFHGLFLKFEPRDAKAKDETEE